MKNNFNVIEIIAGQPIQIKSEHNIFNKSNFIFTRRIHPKNSIHVSSQLLLFLGSDSIQPTQFRSALFIRRKSRNFNYLSICFFPIFVIRSLFFFLFIQQDQNRFFFRTFQLLFFVSLNIKFQNGSTSFEPEEAEIKTESTVDTLLQVQRSNKCCIVLLKQSTDFFVFHLTNYGR